MDIRKCCDLLDLRPGYSQAELRLSYKDLVQIWHPDRFTHNARLKEKAEAKLKDINQAYEILDRALVERARRERMQAAQTMDPNTFDPEAIAREAKVSATWRTQPEKSALKLQLSLIAWIAAVTVGMISSVMMLAFVANHPWTFLAVVVVIGSYVGARLWTDRA
jgi:uncharacterized membrane protein